MSFWISLLGRILLGGLVVVGLIVSGITSAGADVRIRSSLGGAVEDYLHFFAGTSNGRARHYRRSLLLRLYSRAQHDSKEPHLRHFQGRARLSRCPMG
jgi:hypothetical protein